jgi:endoglucanase
MDTGWHGRTEPHLAFPFLPRFPGWLPVVLFMLILLGTAGDHSRSVPSPPAVAPRPPPPPPCAADPAGLAPARGPNGRLLDYWHTCGVYIVDRTGRPIRIAGVAWSGMELGGGAPQGLDRQGYRTILSIVKALGYNVIRIPFNSASIQPDFHPTNIDDRLNPDLRGLTGLEILDHIIAACGRLGLKVILDHHRIAPWSVPPLWFDDTYSEEQWITDWQRLARRYAGNDTVVGFDLQNEPYGATWAAGDPRTDWHRAATRAGNAILAVNPRLLIFVQGIGHDGGQDYWYGGELRGVARAAIHLAIPGRLVYSPHEYGPSVYPQPWFFTPDFPSNLPGIWNTHWGFIIERGLAPVVVGEMGAPETGYDTGGTWQRTLLSYLDYHHLGFITWALNPGSTDTGSVLTSDWRTVNAARQALFTPYLRSSP